MISDYYNTLICINQYSEGTAPDFEASFSLQDEFYGLFDKQSSSRIWNDQGSSIKIDAKLFCDEEPTGQDRIKVIEDHIIATADIGGYHKELGGAWTLTASAAIGDTCIFYQALTNTGTGRKADGDEYTIYSIKNPNMMNRHFEILLQKTG